jgi:ATP-dependent RNA helicase DHX37/DHR1
MAGPPVRERYNAKARGSVAGGGHKKRKRPKNKEVTEDGTPVEQSTAPPEVQGEGDGRGKMSSKKRKRMDSYIVRNRQTRPSTDDEWS